MTMIPGAAPRAVFISDKATLANHIDGTYLDGLHYSDDPTLNSGDAGPLPDDIAQSRSGGGEIVSGLLSQSVQHTTAQPLSDARLLPPSQYFYYGVS